MGVDRAPALAQAPPPRPQALEELIAAQRAREAAAAAAAEAKANYEAQCEEVGTP